MTFGFLYLAVFLLGFTLALVGGLIRRVLHPTEICGWVVVPSHEHWAGLRTPRADLIVSFLTLFGLVTFLVHGFTTAGLAIEMAAGAVAGLMGAIFLRAWLCHGVEPTTVADCDDAEATVVREIPVNGFGQVQVRIGACTVKLAARSASGIAIASGSAVEVIDRQESVVVVRSRA